MTLACILAIASVAYAQAQSAHPPPVTLSVVAVQAVNQAMNDGKHKEYGHGLEGVKDALEDLSSNRFALMSSTTLSAPFGKKSSVELGSGYSLSITPLAREQNGQVRLDVDVLTTSDYLGGQKVSVLSTTVAAGPGKKLKIRGLKMNEGEMVIVISTEK